MQRTTEDGIPVKLEFLCAECKAGVTLLHFFRCTVCYWGAGAYSSGAGCSTPPFPNSPSVDLPREPPSQLDDLSTSH